MEADISCSDTPAFSDASLPASNVTAAGMAASDEYFQNDALELSEAYIESARPESLEAIDWSVFFGSS